MLGACTPQVLPVTDGAELEGACESLALLFDKRQAFYRHTGVSGLAIAGVEGPELLSVLSEEDWRAGVGFADWVGGVVLFFFVCWRFCWWRAKLLCLMPLFSRVILTAVLIVR